MSDGYASTKVVEELVYLTCIDVRILLAANQPVKVCLFGGAAPTHVGITIKKLRTGVQQTYVSEKWVPAI